MASDLETRVLASVAELGQIEDTEEYCKQHAIDHNLLVGVLKSLQSSNMIIMKDIPRSKWVLTPEAKTYLDHGAAAENAFFNAIKQDGVPADEIRASLPPVIADAGFKNAMALKWIGIDKSSGTPCVVRKVTTVDDTITPQLTSIVNGTTPTDEQITYLGKRRKLISLTTWRAYLVVKGDSFALQRVKPATDLTEDLLVDDAWRSRQFKEYNFHALGIPTSGGYLHPLLKVRTQFRKIFTQMGFEEMPTNQWVESSFWNFDTLFQPQQHPARDAHDTFFLTNPATTAASNFPPDYLQRVKDVHQHGGYGSTGYGYAWRLEEAEKNLLRTHTTAVSSRMLYRLAQEGFRPAKYFSIDRVFRNESVDRTHLAEFHQVEGLVCGRGLSLGDLIGTLQTFFARLGLPKLRFKPAYNPYTEPSMEIFSYSEELDKWMEVGNSGMFRPEMLRPMGLPEDVQVIAWGLSLERPTMILYGIDNIRDLFGHKVMGVGRQMCPHLLENTTTKNTQPVHMVTNVDKRSMSPTLTTEPRIHSIVHNGDEAFTPATQHCISIFHKHVREAVEETDRAVKAALDEARSNYQDVVQQCGSDPELYRQCLENTLAICATLKQQLMLGEQQLVTRLEQPMQMLYADLVCSCREQCMGFKHNNPGRNLGMDLQAFIPMVQQSIRQQQAWVASQCAERQRQVSLACDRLVAEVKVAMDNVGEDCSIVDGSVTDLLSNLDDVMSVMSGYSQMTCGSTTAAV